MAELGERVANLDARLDAQAQDLADIRESVNRLEDKFDGRFLSQGLIRDVMSGKTDVIRTIDKDEIEKPLMDLDAVLFGTELKLVTRQDLRSDAKYFADAYKVYMNLLWLGGAVGTGAGDEAGGADYKPRDVAYDILKDQLQQLADAQTAFDSHIAMDMPAFNKMMTGKIPAIRIAR